MTSMGMITNNEAIAVNVVLSLISFKYKKYKKD